MTPKWYHANTGISAGNGTTTILKAAKGHPAFRTSPVRNGVSYSADMQRGEDGQLLQSSFDRNASVKFVCFPIVAYNSMVPLASAETPLHPADARAHNSSVPSTCTCYYGLLCTLLKLGDAEVW
jgi:hypothetical protein